MLNYMLKYNSVDAIDILKQIMENGDALELKEWRTLNLSPMINNIRQQAIQEMFIEKAFYGHTYVDTLINLKEITDSQIFSTWTLVGDEGKPIQTNLQKFEESCKPKYNIIYSRFMFKLHRQNDGENLRTICNTTKIIDQILYTYCSLIMI
ncbi:hypothetical protein ACF0H5_010010 [Mactra antiquata]